MREGKDGFHGKKKGYEGIKGNTRLLLSRHNKINKFNLKSKSIFMLLLSG